MGESRAQKKYDVEHAFSIGCTGAELVSPSQINSFMDDLADPQVYPLYVIAQRPRLRVIDGPALIESGETRLLIRSERPGEPELELFIGLKPDTEIEIDSAGLFLTARYRSEVQSKERIGKVIADTYSNLDLFERKQYVELDEQFLDLEVLYVGKSDDAAGATAARLRNHATLQRILAEQLDYRPNHELWIVPMTFGQSSTMSILDGGVGSEGSEASQKHFENTLSSRTATKDRVALAEASLIRYFQPTYNVHFKKTFPRQEHSSYSIFYQIDYNAIGFTLDTHATIQCRLWSSNVAPTFVHDALFLTTSEEKRRGLLDLNNGLDLSRLTISKPV